jgi:hypothetical protein
VSDDFALIRDAPSIFAGHWSVNAAEPEMWQYTDSRYVSHADGWFVARDNERDLASKRGASSLCPTVGLWEY